MKEVRLDSETNFVLEKEVSKMFGLIFDMDGVLASVGNSYNLSIELTAKHFGAHNTTQDDIVYEKKLGNANNDWILTQRIIKRKLSKDVPLEDIIKQFEIFYQVNLF